MPIAGVWFSVRCWEDAIAFYRNVLGLKEVERDDEQGVVVYDQGGGPPIVLVRQADPSADSAPVVGLVFPNLPALEERLVAAGVEVRTEPRSGGSFHMLVFSDPEGHRLQARPWSLPGAAKSMGADAVIINERGRVLIVRTSYSSRLWGGLWGLPGGSVDAYEGPFDAMAREVKEEVGVDVVDPVLTGLYYRPERDELVLTWRCGIQGEPRAGAEVLECRFAEVGELETLCSAWAVDRVLDALEFDGRVAVRVQRKEGERRLPSRPRPWETKGKNAGA